MGFVHLLVRMLGRVGKSLRCMRVATEIARKSIEAPSLHVSIILEGVSFEDTRGPEAKATEKFSLHILHKILAGISELAAATRSASRATRERI